MKCRLCGDDAADAICFRCENRRDALANPLPREFQRAGRPCLHCGRVVYHSLTRGQCSTCDNYERRHGSKRPITQTPELTRVQEKQDGQA